LLYVALALLVAGVFVFLYRNLNILQMWAYGDLSAFPTDPAVIRDWTFSAWISQGLGFLAFKPFSYYNERYVASALLGPNLAQKVLFLLLPVLSFVTFFLLLKKLNLNPLAAFVGSLLYAVNPVVIAEFVGGSMTLAAYATFPIILLLIIRILSSDKTRVVDLVLLGVLAFFVLNVHAAFWYLLVVVPVAASLLLTNKLSLAKKLGG
jgi:hypothetical protein